jgi:hypothetical protein
MLVLAERRDGLPSELVRPSNFYKQYALGA